MPDATSDRGLVDRLDEVWTSISALGDALTEAEWKQPTDVPGWSVQDNLVHITGAEAWLLGRPPPDHSIPDGLPHVKNEIGTVNEVFVDSRRIQTGADALAEFREVTGTRIGQLHAYGPDDFASDSWTPLGPGAVRDLLPFRMFDSWVHEQDMRWAVGAPGDVATAVGTVALGRITDALPYVVGKQAAAPDGSTVVFELTGSPARTVAVTVDGKRAKVVDALSANADSTIVADVEVFARVACGRQVPGAALADGRITVDGDQALGRSIVEGLNIVPF